MSIELLEDFMNVDLKSFISKVSGKGAAAPADKAETDPATETDQEPTEGEEKKEFPKDLDWKSELESRIAANNQAQGDAKQSPAELEQEFFTDYFNAHFDANIAKHLMTIDLIKRDFKALGFGQTNPLFVFLQQDYVKTNLLATKLLNLNTFKAIHNAFAKRVIANSEFTTVSDYNVLYCKDLYRKSPADMYAYFEQQKELLNPNASSYNAEVQTEVRRAMFSSGFKAASVDEAVKHQKTLTDGQLPTATDSDTKLNTLEFVKHYLGTVASDENEGGSEKDRDTKDDKTPDTSAASIRKFVKNIESKAQAYAAINHIYIVSGGDSADIKKALSNKVFSGVKATEVSAASVAIVKQLRGLKLNKETAESCVRQLMAKVETLP